MTQPSNSYAGIHTGQGRAAVRGEMGVAVRRVMEEDKDAFRELYREMFNFYKKKQLGRDPLEQEFSESFDATWNSILKGESLATIAYATHTQTFPVTSESQHSDIAGQTPVSFTYGMKSLDPRTGKPDMQVEGTWTTESYRRLQVAPKVIEELAAVAAREWGIIGVRFWTFGEGHMEGNPGNLFTRGVYERLKNLNGLSRGDLTSFEGIEPEDVTNRVDRQGFSLPLVNDPSVTTTCGAKILSQDQVGELDAEVRLEMRSLTQIDAAFLPRVREQFNKYASDQGYKPGEINFDAALENMNASDQKEKIEISLITKNGADIGLAIVRNGIKLPRDVFTFADVSALRIDPEQVDQRTVNSVLTGIAQQAFASGNKLVRMTDQTAHPVIKGGFDVAAKIQVENNGAVFQPSRMPLRHFVLPVEKEYCVHQAPFVQHS